MVNKPLKKVSKQRVKTHYKLLEKVSKGKMLKNKKAWLRILEAFIAIILISGILIVLYSKTFEKPKRAEEIYKLQETILDEVAADQELGLREIVVKYESGDIDNKLIDFINSRIPPGFIAEIKICDVGIICELPEYHGEEGKEIYSTERLISSVLQEYNPKTLKIFMWEE